jgi:hypothetical protein
VTTRSFFKGVIAALVAPKVPLPLPAKKVTGVMSGITYAPYIPVLTTPVLLGVSGVISSDYPQPFLAEYWTKNKVWTDEISSQV